MVASSWCSRGEELFESPGPRYTILDGPVRKKGSIGEFLRRKWIGADASDFVNEILIIAEKDAGLATVV